MLRAPYLPRLDLSTLAWVLVAAALALVGGALVGASAQIAFDVVLVGTAVAVFANRPFAVVVALLVLLPALKGAPFDQRSVFLNALTAAAGVVTLLFVVPKSPAKRVLLPLGLLLLIAVPTIRVLPGANELVSDFHLRLPYVGQPYLRTPSNAVQDLLRLTSVFVVLGLAAWTVRTRDRLEIVTVALLVSAIIPIVTAFHQLATGTTVTRPGIDSPPAVEGTFTHPNHFAFYLVVVLTVALCRLLDTQRLFTRVWLIALMAAAGACLFLTYTRSGWIGFGVAVLVVGLLRHRALLLAAPVVLVAAAVALPGAADKVQQRFGDLTSQSESAAENSWAWRTGQWSRMLPYGWQRPVTGEGFGSYPAMTIKRFGVYDPKYPTYTRTREGTLTGGFTAHNDYVKMFVEMGVPGVVLWCLVLTGIFGVALSARRVPALAGPATALAATAVMLMAVSASDNLQGYSVVLLGVFALTGSLAGVAHASGKAAAAAPGGSPAAVDPEVPAGPPPSPDGAAEASQAPVATRRSGGVVGTARDLFRRRFGR